MELFYHFRLIFGCLKRNVLQAVFGENEEFYHIYAGEKGAFVMDVYQTISSLGLVLPPVPPNAGLFVGCKKFGANLLYVSGCGCLINGKGMCGKVGRDVTLEQARQAAADTILNFISVIEKEIGDLNRIVSFVKLLVFVSSDPDFLEQPKVADGATQLLCDIFGERIGCPSRSAVGVAVLPGNISVEIEGVVEFS